jgi:hypothetical protein
MISHPPVTRKEWDFAYYLMISCHDSFAPKFNMMLFNCHTLGQIRQLIRQFRPKKTDEYVSSMGILRSIYEMLGFPNNMEYLNLGETISGFIGMYKPSPFLWPRPVPGITKGQSKAEKNSCSEVSLGEVVTCKLNGTKPEEQRIAEGLLENDSFKIKLNCLLHSKAPSYKIQELIRKELMTVLTRKKVSSLSIIVWLYYLLREDDRWNYLGLPKHSKGEDTIMATKLENELKTRDIFMGDDTFMEGFNKLVLRRASFQALKEYCWSFKNTIDNWSSSEDGCEARIVVPLIWQAIGKPAIMDYLNLTPVVFIRSTTTETITETKKETKIMAKFFDTKILVNGEDLAKMQNSDIYTAISKQSDKIKGLEAIPTKPQMLVNEIAAEKADLDALVEYLNDKSAATTTA